MTVEELIAILTDYEPDDEVEGELIIDGDTLSL
jgi:hypothetical protein